MKGMMNHFKLAIVVCLAFVSVAAGSVTTEGMTLWVMTGLIGVLALGGVLTGARFGKYVTGEIPLKSKEGRSMNRKMNQWLFGCAVLLMATFIIGAVAMEGMASWVMMGLLGVLGGVLSKAGFTEFVPGTNTLRYSLVRLTCCIALIIFVGSVALPISGWAASINVYRFLDDGDNSYNGEDLYTEPGMILLKHSGSARPSYFTLEEGMRLEYPIQSGEYTIWQFVNPASLATLELSPDQIPWSSEDTGLKLTADVSDHIQVYDPNGDFFTSGQDNMNIYFPLPVKVSQDNDDINQKKQEMEEKCATPDIVLCGYDPDQDSWPNECYEYSDEDVIIIEMDHEMSYFFDMDNNDVLSYWNEDSISVNEDFISIKEAIKGKIVVSYGMVKVPYYNATDPLSVLGMCNYGILKSPRGAESLTIEFEDVLNDRFISKEENFFANFGKIEGSTPFYPVDGYYDHSLKGGNITLAGTCPFMPGLLSGNFYNEGLIQGGNSVKFTYEEGFDGYVNYPDEYFDQQESTGGSVSISFANLYTKNAILGGEGFSMHYQDSGEALSANIWDETIQEDVNYGAGKGGDVTLETTFLFASVTSFVKGGDGGDVTADYTCEGCNIEVKGGIGGTVDIWGEELQGAGGFKGGSVYIEPDIMISGKDTQIEAEKDVVIFGGDNWQLKLNDLNDNAIVAGRNIILAVGNGGVIDLRGNNSKVFKAGGKVEIYADNVLLDQGVQLEDIIQASEIVEGPNKIIYRVTLNAQDARGQANETVSVELNVSNAGPDEDSYNLSVVSEKGTAVDGLPSTVQVQGLGHKRLLLNITLPATAGVSDKVTIKATSHKDPNVFATKQITVSTEPAPDSDGDGITDDQDIFPNDPEEWLDSDGDGTGDNADTDDDNDEMPDTWEAAHGLNPIADDAWEDPDGDDYSNLREYRFGSDPNAPDSYPRAGLFRVGEDGSVIIDWLYDGGMYKGEFGIFSLEGMDLSVPDLEAFITEAASRVMSGTAAGHIVISDKTERARFSGTLSGESGDWNEGDYNHAKSVIMTPGDRFALVLVPNGSFEALSHNPGTGNTHLRPLFSFISPNADYGMHTGQVADINGMGFGFVFEDMEFTNSDRDYNDLIIQISGAESNVPTIDAMIGVSGQSARSKRGRKDWHDWRASDELGRKIIEHLEALPAGDDPWASVAFDGASALNVYDRDNRVIGTDGAEIPGSLKFSAEGEQKLFLPALRGDSDEYRVMLRSAGDGTGNLTVTGYAGTTEMTSETKPVGIGRLLRSELSVYSDPGQVVNFTEPAGTLLPYNVNGDGKIDDSDIEQFAFRWNVCQDDPEFEEFFDLDNDGCVTVLDLMRVVNSR